MALPIVSVPIKKKQKPSLALTLSATGLLIIGGGVAYRLFSQGHLYSGNLLVGANLIPSDALFAVSLTTDTKQWEKLQEFGTKESQAELNKSLIQLRDRFLTNNGFNFEQDIQPWVDEEVTFAILAPETSQTAPKPVVTDGVAANNQQSVVMVLPVKNPELAQKILAQPKALKTGKWIDSTYEGIAIKQSEDQSGTNLSATLLDKRYLVITDNSKATKRAIDAYKNQTSLATVGGFAENFPKISQSRSFAQFYVNVPRAAKIATTAPNRRLPAQVLAQLQNNQGLAGTMTLEPEGIRLKGVSWLNPQSQRLLSVDNTASSMQQRMPAETLMMFSGSNLQRFWGDYLLTSQGNPLSPVSPDKLRSGVKSLINLDLEQDLLSWMKGEFAVSLIPNTLKNGTPGDFRAGLVFMIKASDRKLAETSLQKLDEVIKTQYQFQIQPGTVAGQPVVNWIGPFGTLTASHGWLDKDIAFLVLGAPVTDKIVPKPNTTLASNLSYQNTVPTEPNPTNGQFFVDVERMVNNFTLNTLFPKQRTFLEATRSIGITTAVSDSRSHRYDIFLSLKKSPNSATLPNPSNSPNISNSLSKTN
ncbi:DUF3352 domain-containing protein [Fortiea sp. LEGE XX443]|uniref:DUF3352 domain-containing protein n=1 Tax=Fortiea sp. LEGE XX443 TaxID=1828611 RepID=UPI0018817447|nr:DUF3352 domain-containing protein [Fortiea sp. LEGE XX443]MBE9007700.1 DUF3352 domain-containing protein [Fortiea sp. LEGE XX443]